ncbi:MAG: RNA methyltransferase [Clostridiales bacterium]|nr:RNA methyltransferase [Clostridiales bacterium]
MKNELEPPALKSLEAIISPSNQTIKNIKSLRNKKYRDQHCRFLVEGQKMVEEALDSNFELEMLAFSESYTDSLPIRDETPQRTRYLKVTEQIFKTLSDTQSPQGVLAVVKPKEWNYQQTIELPKGFLVILDGVKDLGNLGTIVRTVDAAGGDGVILINECVDPYNPKAVRATMGSVFRVPIFQVDNSEALLECSLAKTAWHLVASGLQGEDVFMWQGNYPKIALVMGSESHGVSQQIIDKSHSVVRIPMVGGAESLNASVAAGILTYEIFRKKRNMDS